MSRQNRRMRPSTPLERMVSFVNDMKNAQEEIEDRYLLVNGLYNFASTPQLEKLLTLDGLKELTQWYRQAIEAKHLEYLYALLRVTTRLPLLSSHPVAPLLDVIREALPLLETQQAKALGKEALRAVEERDPVIEDVPEPIRHDKVDGNGVRPPSPPAHTPKGQKRKFDETEMTMTDENRDGESASKKRITWARGDALRQIQVFHQNQARLIAKILPSRKWSYPIGVVIDVELKEKRDALGSESKEAENQKARESQIPEVVYATDQEIPSNPLPAPVEPRYNEEAVLTIHLGKERTT